MAQAEEALKRHEARKAIDTAQAASETAQSLINALNSYEQIRAGIVQGRNDAEELEAGGYRMEASRSALDGAQVALNKAADTLQRGALAEALTALQATQVMLDEAIAKGRGVVAVQEENNRRLPEIEAQGAAVAALIAEGRQTFDIVDEFAESTWSDIRGNGSEAQAAADHAHERWQSAGRRNTMEVQEFWEAKQDLDAAAESLAYARTLIDAITARLKDLEAARANARDELAAAQADIARGWEFVRSNDPDIGKEPEQQLRQAEQLVASAQAEMGQGKPDWLVLVRNAQQANELADQALLRARSEYEAMEKLRVQTTRAQQLATAEVEKIVQFFGVHREDIQAENQRAIGQIQQQVQQAYGIMQQSAQTEEEQRRDTLQQAYEHYTALQTQAAKVYERVYNDFQRLEQLRGEMNQELNRARDALASAEGALASVGALPGRSGPEQQIRTARHNYDSIRRPVTGEPNMRAAIDQARRIRSAAQDAENDLRRIQRRSHPGPDPGSVIGGMILGEILDQASRGGGRHGGGRHGGGGGGGGGGGWGSLGGGGGSWGGGGGGGGSWGGGGGGGGGW